ncbi:hypothetical protein BDR07DRAFT_1404808, partial [Suillus spraguei]
MLPLTGCVAFDGMSIVINQCNVSISMLPAEFASADYRHCVVFCNMASSCERSMASYVALQLQQYLLWFYYGDDAIVYTLNTLSVLVLSQCSQWLGSNIKHLSKVDHIRHILQCLQSARSDFNTLSPISAAEHLSNIHLPSTLARYLLPLLCAHFVSVFGDEVADALRRPPPLSYAVQSRPPSQIS